MSLTILDLHCAYSIPQKSEKVKVKEGQISVVRGDKTKIALGSSLFLSKSNFFEKSKMDRKGQTAHDRAQNAPRKAKNRTAESRSRFPVAFSQGLISGGDAVPRHGADDPGVWNVE